MLDNMQAAAHNNAHRAQKQTRRDRDLGSDPCSVASLPGGWTVLGSEG